jgi:serine/threonine protein kinase
MQILYATRLEDEVKVVIKTRLKQRSFKTAAEEKAWRRSTECQLNMPKIDTMCQFLEVLETPRFYYVVMEKVDGQDLCEQLDDEHMSHLDAREVMRQILLAVAEMHRQGRIHKDLKLENVMVNLHSRRGKERVALAEANGSPMMSAAEVKLIDFDTVIDWEPSQPKKREIQGTDGYIAPEAYDGEYSPASDMYAVGVIMYKILTGRWPSRREIFDDGPGENYAGSIAMKRIQMRLKSEIVDFTSSPFDGCAEAADLAAKLLAYDAESRPSAEQALAHEWFLVRAEALPPTPGFTTFCC